MFRFDFRTRSIMASRIRDSVGWGGEACLLSECYADTSLGLFYKQLKVSRNEFKKLCISYDAPKSRWTRQPRENKRERNFAW